MATEINPAKEEVRAGGGGDDVSKKLKREEDNDGAGGERGDSSSEEPVVSLGGMKFRTSREIFEYFDSLLSSWLSSDFNVVGKDYYPMLLDLVKKGHPEPEKMIGSGLTYFHVHRNGLCSGYLTFYLRNEDVRARDFCFRSCVHNILPLPEDLMKELGTGVVVCACHLPRPKDEEVILQPRKLSTSTGVLSHFFDLLYFSPLNEPITDGRRVVLLELLRKGDPVGWENKFGSGSKVDQYSFEVRIHPNPVYIDIGLRSFFLVHQRDGSVEEFCYIKLIENISPLPEKSIDYFIHPCSCHHGGGNKSDVVSLGISKFRTSEEMVEYFRHWLFYQPLDTPITDGRFCTVARDLVRKGDLELGKKIGSSSGGFQSYSIQVRRHPVWPQRSYFLVREDGSMELFCFWTCINNILPLAEEYSYNCCRATGECRDVIVAAAAAGSGTSS